MTFVTPWTAACQPSLSFSISRTLLNYVHWVNDAIQTPHPLSLNAVPALNLSQHQGLFQWVSSSHQVAKVLELDPLFGFVDSTRDNVAEVKESGKLNYENKKPERLLRLSQAWSPRTCPLYYFFEAQHRLELSAVLKLSEHFCSYILLIRCFPLPSSP